MKLNFVFASIASLVIASSAHSAEVMKLAVTTSFQNSGLAEILLPEILTDLDLEVQLLVVGTGQAIKLGEAGDVDAVLVHSRSAEEAFVEAGFGTHRREIMYNDFVFVGPQSDEAGAETAGSAAQALQKIAAAQADFVSRGDDSGTHKMELNLWKAAELDVAGFGDWYKAVGAGMGAALNTASGLGAYILSDRASWLNFGNKGDLAIVFEGDPALFNQYAYLPVNPDLHSHVRSDLAEALEDWLVSDKAKTLINGYQINGEPLFVFNAVVE
ncbi:substrate-binding domain-containing protein [Marivivens sp. LCG002]|uniref:substrate-binding domain-containing protein n=1 Tax=Marivivens sp. LCG002 TaxID=3051171 RepID=UPI0025576AFA|nr:substrate-binding domain-containing protein [Marivivens sp. LCG002]WIV51353.1 substrate-binding domain-containing protein [Marivivens sp. LCG002]